MLTRNGPRQRRRFRGAAWILTRTSRSRTASIVVSAIRCAARKLYPTYTRAARLRQPGSSGNIRRSSSRGERLQEWVEAHPKGTPIGEHYDPASHENAVVVAKHIAFG